MLPTVEPYCTCIHTAVCLLACMYMCFIALNHVMLHLHDGIWSDIWLLFSEGTLQGEYVCKVQWDKMYSTSFTTVWGRVVCFLWRPSSHLELSHSNTAANCPALHAWACFQVLAIWNPQVLTRSSSGGQGWPVFPHRQWLLWAHSLGSWSCFCMAPDGAYLEGVCLTCYTLRDEIEPCLLPFWVTYLDSVDFQLP